MNTKWKNCKGKKSTFIKETIS